MNFGSIVQTYDFANPTDVFFFFNDTATTEIYTLSLHDALPISAHNHKRGEWARVVLSVDLTSTPRKVAKFINEIGKADDWLPDSDESHMPSSSSPEIFMFGDGDDDERTDCYLNSLQIRQGAMTD